MAAAELVDEIGDQAVRDAAIDRAAFAEGYRAGFAAGVDVGYRRAVNELTDVQHQEARDRRGQARLGSWAEFEHRMWDGPRKDFGNPRPGDHPGGPVPVWGLVA